jgi:NAD(P)-dependent dehydrogenase (short-subunit alcohol dehydrogenase family)
VVELDDRVVIVTGGGRGMGLEHARLLSRAGALLVLNDVGCDRDGSGSDPTVVERAAESIRAEGGRVVTSAADVSTTPGAQSVVDLALSEYGALHGLVNNAGILRDRMFVNMTDDDWDEVIRGHLRATFAPTRAAAQHWRDRSKAGDAVQASVVSMSSTSGLIGAVGQSNYGAAKAGIAALTVILAQELGRYGVRVNALTPVARTRMTEEAPGVRDLVKVPDDPSAFDTYHPGHVSPLVLWLLSQGCPATGEVFYARGGEIRRYAPWGTAATITSDGPWDADDIAARLGPLVSPDPNA